MKLLYRRIEIISIIGFVCLFNNFFENVYANPSEINTEIKTDSSIVIQILDFKNTDIKDVVRAIADTYGLNIFVEDAIDYRVTIHLENVSINDALNFLANRADLEIQQEGSIIKFLLPPPEPIPPLDISFNAPKLSLDVKNEPVSRVVKEISQICSTNIVLNKGVSGTVSGFLQNLDLEECLATFFSMNGYEVKKKNSIYHVDWGMDYGTETTQQKRRGSRIDVVDGLISMDFHDVEIKQAVQEIAQQVETDIIVYGNLEGRITAKCSNITFDDALNYLFKGTKYTFRKDEDIYFIGDKTVQGINSSKLIKLQHLKAEGLIETIPKEIIQGASIKIIKEHNGLMVTGAENLIRETEDYIRQIDYPIPQILIEALVVDYNMSDIDEFSIEAGLGDPNADDTTGVLNYRSLFPNVEQSANGDFLNASIELYGPQWGLPNVGKLPSNFYMQVKALEQESKAKVRSRPQIATLNGHTASINIGTTQYYKIKTQTPYQSTQQLYVSESERFETIKAEMILEITPWVSASGEITTEIHPEFSTPKGSLDSETPPTIDHRILSSTIRLKDGETIVLGGLIQEVDSKTYQKFPILGDIPLLGRLFRNHNIQKTTTELMIYVTPHLYYEDLGKVDVEEIIK